MKINRFIALAAITLLAIGAMGTISARAFAQGSTPVAQTSDCSAQDVDATEAAETGPDTDDIEEHCGEQVEDGQPDGAEEAEEADSGVQEPSYTGSISVDQAQNESLSEVDEAAALQGQAAITAADAEAAALAANPGASVVKTELDNENGALVYSVELSNGADVKVDAGNAAILFSDSDADNEG